MTVIRTSRKLIGGIARKEEEKNTMVTNREWIIGRSAALLQDFNEREESGLPFPQYAFNGEPVSTYWRARVRLPSATAAELDVAQRAIETANARDYADDATRQRQRDDDEHRERMREPMTAEEYASVNADAIEGARLQAERESKPMSARASRQGDFPARATHCGCREREAVMQLGHAALDYRKACDLLNVVPTATCPREREAQIPTWLQTELVGTRAAEAKLRDWSKLTPPPWTNPDAGTILADLHFFGDLEVAAHTAHVLSQLPAPVTEYARRTVTFTGAGISVAGHCGPRPDFTGRCWWIGLSASDGVERLRDVIAHEVAHSWLLNEPAPGTTTKTAFAWSTLAHLPLPDDLPAETVACVEKYRAQDNRHEDETKRLTRVWGFQDV